ncbi:hypothetical protein [Lentibacillus sp. CBA3610]|uniref:hypothetical protein n=1 Tax=Lentibacillus sp. CBA3610 TaxID=2518176 RepID=UPI001595D5D9|nr:hypothetical protein [Lentibacillus sp. CBA3610]QKY68434.1 hypothetical protein Len3610_01280 [Lentibacillus sp. CBA3610]
MAQRNPDAPNQIVLFQELLQDKIEHKPHACPFFSYLAEELDLTYYERYEMGAPPYTAVIVTAVIFLRHVPWTYAAQKNLSGLPRTVLAHSGYYPACVCQV